MALTVVISNVCFVVHLSKCGILVFRASSIDAHSIAGAITEFTLSAVASLIPPGTVPYNMNTDIFPFGTSLKAFNTMLSFIIPIFAEINPTDVRHEVLGSGHTGSRYMGGQQKGQSQE